MSPCSIRGAGLCEADQSALSSLVVNICFFIITNFFLKNIFFTRATSFVRRTKNKLVFFTQGEPNAGRANPHYHPYDKYNLNT